MKPQSAMSGDARDLVRIAAVMRFRDAEGSPLHALDSGACLLLPAGSVDSLEEGLAV
jgi:hypothetical protein